MLSGVHPRAPGTGLDSTGRLGVGQTIPADPVAQGAWFHPDFLGDLIHRAVRSQDEADGFFTESWIVILLATGGHLKRGLQSSCLTKPYGRISTEQRGSYLDDIRGLLRDAKRTEAYG